MNMFYSKDGRPLDQRSAWILMEDQYYKRVALTEIGPYVVSTVWLGLDHNFGFDGPPLIFETMVFTTSAWHEDRPYDDPEREGLLDIDCRRYPTLEEAETGHEEMVTLVKATLQEELPDAGTGLPALPPDRPGDAGQGPGDPRGD
jgi:hypothetical protein